MKARLEKALDLAGRTHEISDVVEAIRAGRMQCFSSDKAFVVTEIASYPRKKHMNVFLAVGELADVMSLQPQIAAFAREHGCKALVMSGRRGWSSVLPHHGWSPVGVTYALPLEASQNG